MRKVAVWGRTVEPVWGRRREGQYGGAEGERCQCGHPSPFAGKTNKEQRLSGL